MNLIRFIAQALPLALRLLVVLAVCGLSVAQAGAAMHGKTCASEVQTGLKQQKQNHLASTATHNSGGHTHDYADLGDGNSVEIGDVSDSSAGQFDANKSDCCKSFCSSVALLGGTPLKSQFEGTSRLNAHIVKQLEAAADAAIFTPPNA